MFKFFLFLLVLFAVSALAWMMFLPMVVVQSLNNRTGFDVKIDSLSVNPFTAKVHVRGLKIGNPEGFPVKDFIDVRELRADADLFSLFGETFIIDDAVVNVAQVSLVKNKAGQTNAVLFKERLTGLKSDDGKTAQTRPSAAVAGKRKDFLIRKLELHFDRLLTVDETGTKSGSKEMNLNFSHSYENVTSPVQIAVPIVGKVADLGGSLGDYAGRLGPQALEATKKATDKLKDLGRKAGEKLKGLLQSINDKSGS